MLKNNTDIIIVGGGLSGLCIAAMLGKLKFNIILIDKQKITKNNIIHKDTRTVAISLGTKQLFQEHGLWSEISNDTHIGIGSIKLNNAKIGKNCIVGANTLITENKIIPDNSLVVGSPGRVLRKVTDEEIKAVLENGKHYVDFSKKYKK